MKNRRLENRGLWGAALREVQNHILFAIGAPALSRPQKKALLAIYAFCRQRIKDGPSAPAPNNRELASKYGVSLRSVTNWRREGCPFDQGQVKVLDWLSERRYAPAGTREKFSRQLGKRGAMPFMYRRLQKALDDVRQFKRDCLTHGYQPPEWTKGFRATRCTKGLPVAKRAKSHRNIGKKPKTRSEAAYFAKIVRATSKVASAD